jgi:hypothetical protein
MIDLTGEHPTLLVPSSMSAGNTQADPRSTVIAMTAPGGEGILPPSPTSDTVVPIGCDGRIEDYVHLITDGGAVASGRPRSQSFQSADDIPGPGKWRETP